MNAFPNPQLAQQWRDRLNRFDGTGLTVAEFCRSEGYSVGSFYQWRKRFQQAVADHDTFVAVELPINAQEPQRPVNIAIELPGGAVVRLDALADQLIHQRLVAAIIGATDPRAQAKETA